MAPGTTLDGTNHPGRGAGAPGTTVQIRVRLTAGQAEALRATARREGQSVEAVLRGLIATYTGTVRHALPPQASQPIQIPIHPPILSPRCRRCGHDELSHGSQGCVGTCGCSRRRYAA